MSHAEVFPVPEAVAQGVALRQCQVPGDVPTLDRRSRRILARAGGASRLDQVPDQDQGRRFQGRRAHPLVRGRRPERQRQLHRPPPGERAAIRPRSCGKATSRPSRQEDHLPRAARPGVQARQRAEGPRRQEGRPGHDLHADDPRDRLRHAGVRPDRRDPLGGVRRLLARQPGRTGSTTATASS